MLDFLEDCDIIKEEMRRIVMVPPNCFSKRYYMCGHPTHEDSDKRENFDTAVYELKDSGKRESFDTGAVRDVREGKGRYDLISPFALKRLAIVLEKGAKKYAERNWEKGMPVSRTLDSAIRHLYQYIEGQHDEDHLGHAMFNVMAVIHYEEMIRRGVLEYKKLWDLPDYDERNHRITAQEAQQVQDAAEKRVKDTKDTMDAPVRRNPHDNAYFGGGRFA